jgi:hypothetical protein
MDWFTNKKKENDEWFSPDVKLPEDQQPCKLIIQFDFIVDYDAIVRNVMEATDFEGIYIKKDNYWMITSGLNPSGFLYSRVVKWRPIIKEEK